MLVTRLTRLPVTCGSKSCRWFCLNGISQQSRPRHLLNDPKLLQEESIKRRDSYYEFPASSVDELQVRMFGGNLVVAAHPPGSSKEELVIVNIQWDPARPQLTPSVSNANNKLTVRSSGMESFIGQRSAYVVEILVPVHHLLSTRVRMGVGTVYIAELTGDCMVNLGIGTVNGQLTCDTQLRLGIGSVAVGLPNLSHERKMNIKAGLGSVALYLPSSDDSWSLFPKGKSGHRVTCANGSISNKSGADLRASVGLGDISMNRGDLKHRIE
jgi:hypothetical protein